jgi:small multidrug resistance pump
MDGTMDRIWHRHAWLRPFFTVLAGVHILFPESGRNVPAAMTIAPVKSGIAWRRTFLFAKTRRFDATMTYQRRLGIVERLGPRGVIEVPWLVHSLARDTIEITTGRLRLRAGRLQLPIPGVLQVAVRAVERATGNAVHIDLTVTHPVLGPVFGYDGTFRVRREALDGEVAEPCERSLDRYRGWFYAAAAYNLAWGTVAILRPTLLFQLLGIPPPRDVAIWQALGMMVLVYAPAYWWLARDPVRHRHLALIALLGKVLGPLGFLWGLSTHALPFSFGLIILTNDCIWWPAFAAFLRDAARICGGWGRLLEGR